MPSLGILEPITLTGRFQDNVEDYYSQGKRWWLRLAEKGGKQHEMPAHHKLEEYLDAFLSAAGIEKDKKSPLFRTVKGRTKKLTENRLSAVEAWKMVQRRARTAELKTKICNHSFRATGITNYLENGGSVENAQKMAGHSSIKTTKLYDRRDDRLTLDEVEKIAF